MKKLFTTLRCAYLLWKMGFYLSDNTKTYSWTKGEVRVDGFIRLNFENGKVCKYCLADVDFLTVNNKVSFIDMKSDNTKMTKTTFRYDIGRG